MRRHRRAASVPNAWDVIFTAPAGGHQLGHAKVSMATDNGDNDVERKVARTGAPALLEAFGDGEQSTRSWWQR